MHSTVKSLEINIILQFVLLLAGSLIFYTFPQIDIWFSSLFYDVQEDVFPASHNAFFQFIRKFGLYLPMIAALSISAMYMGQSLFSRAYVKMQPKRFLFVLLSGLIAPGLIVNLILKNHWGRPRPDDVYIFGGEFPMQRAWEISDYCQMNCSFSSGEAATAFWFLSVLVFFRPKVQQLIFMPSLLLVSLISLNRVAFGRHFLSDIVVSAMISWIVMSLCWLFLSRTDFGRYMILLMDDFLQAIRNWIFKFMAHKS